MKKRVLSGIQPTGALHIGNYIGAVQQWIGLQDDPQNDAFYFIVDSHAITVRQNPDELRANVRLALATYLACGLNPDKASIFVQSYVSEHAELAWVLNTFTQMGELERMTQFKDKVAKGKAANAGLFTYPVLMAADILLYQSEMVPVGDDQKQHVELTRNIAERFNNHYGSEVFKIPEVINPKEGARIMGLDDASNKMSKSASSEMNYISLMDDMDVVRKKIMKAKTDSDGVVGTGEDKPEMTNLLTIYSLLSGKSIEELVAAYEGRGYGDFKKEMAEAVVAWLEPIQTRINEYLADEAQLDAIAAQGADQARVVAQETLMAVYKAVGLR